MKKLKGSVQTKSIRPDYIIIPAAGSLLSDDFVSRCDPEKLDAALKRMLKNSGVKKRENHDGL